MEKKITPKNTIENLINLDFSRYEGQLCSFSFGRENFLIQLMMKNFKHYLGTISESPFFLAKEFLAEKYKEQSGYEKSKFFYEQLLHKNVFSVQYHHDIKTLAPLVEIIKKLDFDIFPIGFDLKELINCTKLKESSKKEKMTALININALSKNYFPLLSQNQKGIELHELIGLVQELVTSHNSKHIIFFNLSEESIYNPELTMSPLEETTRINLGFLFNKIKEVYTQCQ